ncbi:hypothetical protein OBBRIDRAFT_889230 [Obba rivulosa]|uniref:GST N-terminal domain-containing protein n=1 Tax=Obba rivulosa TaxID=1052685 RepID=A0A8E2AUB3_9APHY|nr:hypothetical protein OBBRIDRAFT_889230 [Obba rivulosa]
MASNAPVVLYQYDASPISTKVKNILALKGIPHKRVNVATMPPRPELLMLGVSYRLIPVLAIGNDVYCDSSLIAPVLERRFPPSEGYGTIFPKRKGGGNSDPGIIKAYSTFYVEKVISSLVSKSIPFHKFGPAFVKDRSEWLGIKIDPDPKKLEEHYPYSRSALASHLLLLEEQLADGREWLMDTETPSLADLSAHLVFNWVRFFKALRDVYKEHGYPRTTSWLTRLSEYLDERQKTGKAAFENISGPEGADIVWSSPYEDLEFIGFDDLESGRLHVKRGEIVSIIPDDNGKVPTVGKLVALNREEAVIEVTGSSGSLAYCHFPRIAFTIQSESRLGAKL